MENLKNNINKTDTLKNDLKLARNKINDKILSGGGTIADTLNDVPSAIDNMLKENYKKVAIIDLGTDYTFTHSYDKNIPIGTKTNYTIKMNGINFTPSKIFINVYFDQLIDMTPTNTGLCELNKNYEAKQVRGTLKFNFSLSENEIKLNSEIVPKENEVKFKYIIPKIIAIE